MQDFWTWIANAAAITAILGFIIVIWQQVRQARAAEEDVRAYIHVETRKEVFDGGREMVTLVVFNSGEVAARDVFIKSPANVDWIQLQGGMKPEFASEASKLSVLPGEELQFLLGPLSALPVFKNGQLELAIRYKCLPNNRRESFDVQAVSLYGDRYLLRRRIR